MRPLLDVAAPGSVGTASTSYGSQMNHIQRLRHGACSAVHLRSRPTAASRNTLQRRPVMPPLRASEEQKSSTGGTETESSTGPSGSATDASHSVAAANTANTASGGGDDVELKAELGSMWESVKRDLRQGLSPEETQVLDSIKVDDLMGDSSDLMRKIADEQLGPLLRSLGLSDDPLDFFLDLLRLGTGLQLLSAGVLFYGAELWGGYDSGEAFRCVCGLAAGYLSRPFFKVELLLWPVYDWGLRILAPGAVYEVSGSPGDVQSTLTRLGLAVALCSLVPRVLWDWDTTAVLQFVAPLAAGWLLFDVAYIAALLVKLQQR